MTNNSKPDAVQLATAEPHFFSELSALLDDAVDKIRRGDILSAYRSLERPLADLWARACLDDLADITRWHCRCHPLNALVQRDPFTGRAANKPRGYAGDAVMMDYIYYSIPPEETGELEKNLFHVSTRASTALSVCFRRQLLRSLIDDTVFSVPGARLLSVASGHAREISGSLVESAIFDGEFIALDQDHRSCAEILRSYAGKRVQTVNMGIVDLLKGSANVFGAFDLIYSAGLYDYLTDSLARRLTRRLLQMLRPNGRLMIANFIPDAPARGFMELFMDWNLVMRTEDEMRKLAEHAGGTNIRTFIDPHRCVVYAEMTSVPQTRSTT